MKKFERPHGHERCRTSSTIAETMSFGRGDLDENGFWEYGCYECARAWEKQFPQDGPCWPHTKETLEKWKRQDEERKAKEAQRAVV